MALRTPLTPESHSSRTFNERLCCRSTHRSAGLCGSHDAFRVIRGNQVAGPGAQGRGPHLVVGAAMRADDRGSWELARQMLQFQQAGFLNIENGNTRSMLGDAGAEFIDRCHVMNGTERNAQRGNESFRERGITMEDNQFLRLHTSSASTAVHGVLWLQQQPTRRGATADDTDAVSYRGEFTSGPTGPRSTAQTIQPGASHSASAEFLLCPLLDLTPCGRPQKAASLLRIA